MLHCAFVSDFNTSPTLFQITQLKINMSLDSLVYLDYNATTPVADEVVESMTTTLKTAWGNPSSGYKHGKVAKQILENARSQVADMIGAKPGDIIFTSGGTEVSIINKIHQLKKKKRSKILNTIKKII
jgi:cysteine sulfinate desulfinase/cysteine desulfurase-like protein